MKRFFSMSMSVLLTSVLCFCSYAKTDDDEEDGEPIPIQYYEPGEGNDIKLRAPAFVPIQCELIASPVRVKVIFLYGFGDVTICLTNQTTLTSTNTLVDSSCGSCHVPITGGSGTYHIEFQTEDGTVYFGYFVIL